MDLINYDFESQIEQGFQTLFDSIGKKLYTADDVDGELPNEHIKLEIDTGGPNSNEHLNAGGVYDNYTGSIEVTIQTPRVADDQVTITAGFKSRHAELVAITRKTLEEIDATVLSTNWPNALSPTKIKPSGTERDNDAEHRTTVLSYELQFRIA